jgi:DNA-binding PucR family transcriptional regulator
MPIAGQLENATPPGRRPQFARTDGSTEVPAWRGGYRPCVLTWAGGEPSDALVAQMRHAALRWDRRNRLISVDRDTQVLLVAEGRAGDQSRGRLREAVGSVLEVAQGGRPEAEVHTVVGERMAPGERFAVVASRLRRLGRYADARGARGLVWARRYSLACLLETLDPRQTSAFIEGQLAILEAYDREHGTNLQRVLELALDHQSRITAARAAFMHRNTFRRQLGRALELTDVDLGCPEERLALHVALKLRALREPQLSASSPAAP